MNSARHVIKHGLYASIFLAALLMLLFQAGNLELAAGIALVAIGLYLFCGAKHLVAFAFRERKSPPTAGHRSCWSRSTMNSARHVIKHSLYASIFLAALLMLLFQAAAVWQSTYLDFFGEEAQGTATPVRDGTIKYTFDTKEGRRIIDWRHNVGLGSTFLYDPEKPRVFKAKGAGRKSQLLFVALFVAFVWEVVQLFRYFGGSKLESAGSRGEFWKSR